MNRRNTRILTRFLSAASLLALAGLAGCSGGATPSSNHDGSFSTGLDALAAESGDAPETATPSDRLPEAEEGVSLSEILARADRAHKADDSHTYQEISPPTEPVATPAPVAPAPVKHAAPVEKPLSRSERIAKLSTDLRAALASEAPKSEGFRNALAFAALSLANPQLAGASDADLSESERQVVTSVRNLMASLASAQGDPETAAKAFMNASDALDPQRSVKISRVELCSSVSGYGRYEPFGGAFPAGRPNKVIVYTELDRFSHRSARDGDPGRSLGSASEGDLWAVEVSQELRMTHDADGSMQWRTPEETIIEVARNRRRDFYLVQSVSLPQTLSVGNYALKVIVRDKVSGSTDERIIPVRIVADPALARDR